MSSQQARKAGLERIEVQVVVVGDCSMGYRDLNQTRMGSSEAGNFQTALAHPLFEGSSSDVFVPGSDRMSRKSLARQCSVVMVGTASGMLTGDPLRLGTLERSGGISNMVVW